MDPSVPAPSAGADARILVCGWSGAGNVGDELLLSAVVEQLRSNGAVPVVVSRDPAATTALHGVEALAWGPRGWRRLLAEGAGRGVGVDGVCVGPGGIIQDSSSIWSLPGHLAGPGWLRRIGKPVVGVGLGAQALKRASSRRLLHSVLGDVPVVVRDPESAAAMSAAGVEATVGADLVFGLDFEPPARRTEIVVAVGPSVGHGRLRPAERRLVAEDPSRLAAAVGVLAERLQASIALAAFRGERDRRYARLLASRIGRGVEILDSGIDTQVDRIRSARLLVTSRYHPLVVAARSGTPAIVCSTEPKLASLVSQLDTPRVARLDDWSKLSVCGSAEPGDPVVPEGVGLHHDALRRLVAASAPG